MAWYLVLLAIVGYFVLGASSIRIWNAVIKDKDYRVHWGDGTGFPGVAWLMLVLWPCWVLIMFGFPLKFIAGKGADY